MCGIAGIVEQKPGAAPARDVLERMASLLQHRGPDDQGIAVRGEAGLAHRRLSIIDLSGGHQPMEGAGGALTIVFNGEIYNFREVRSALESKGAAFATRSDTEVLLQAYAAWGERCVERLNGMFAFAIWDAPRRRLFAARDRLGKKPFYYVLTADRFVFASELKAVLAAPGVPREVDPEAVDEFLSSYYVGGARTILRNVAKLPPAHWLTLEGGRLAVQRYWRPTFRADDPPRRDEEYQEELESRFRDSVRRRLISDVPLGAFLSGGVDSSAVVAMMAAEGGPRVKTFTIGFEEAGYSEIEDARVVARHLGTDHNEHLVKPEATAIRALRRLVHGADLVRVSDGAAGRDRGTLRRRRRRAIRGLRPVPAGPGGPPVVVYPGADPAPRARASRGCAPHGRAGAEPALRRRAPLGPDPRLRPGPLPVHQIVALRSRDARAPG